MRQSGSELYHLQPSLSPVSRVPITFLYRYEWFRGPVGRCTHSLLICRPLHGLLVQAGKCARGIFHFSAVFAARCRSLASIFGFAFRLRLRLRRDRPPRQAAVPGYSAVFASRCRSLATPSQAIHYSLFTIHYSLFTFHFSAVFLGGTGGCVAKKMQSFIFSRYGQAESSTNRVGAALFT